MSHIHGKPLVTRAEQKREKAVKPPRGIAQRTPMKAVNEKTGGHRFPAGVIQELREFTRHRKCVVDGFPGETCEYAKKRDPVTGASYFGSDPCHRDPEARGVGDYNMLFPGCRKHHREQEGRNPQFEAKYALSLKKESKINTTLFLASKGLNP